MYYSDLTDAQWRIIAPLLPDQTGSGPGRPPTTERRAVFNAILYLTRTGCQWRSLPNDFPHWRTVYDYFSRWLQDGTLEAVHDALRDQVRDSAGRKPEPTAAIMDSQSVKTAGPGEERGYDGNKKVKGRKRHIAVDVLGLLLVLVVHSAGVVDCKGGHTVLEQLFRDFPTIRKVWADGGYKGKPLQDRASDYDAVLEVILPDKSRGPGFNLRPWCWIVERTFAWLKGCRRLAKDYEVKVEHSRGFILLAMSHLMVKRLTA